MQSKLAIIILAAGTSSRMKGIKQLLKIGNKTLLEYTIDVAKSINDTTTFCVLGANFEVIFPQIQHTNVEIIKNKEYCNGLSTSIVTALKTINLNFDACLFLLVDQPEVNTAFLKKIINLHQKNPSKIIATSYNNNVGVPALFPKTFFDELMLLQGDVGAKKIIQKNINTTHLIYLKKPLLDLDTPQDYNNFKKCK